MSGAERLLAVLRRARARWVAHAAIPAAAIATIAGSLFAAAATLLAPRAFPVGAGSVALGLAAFLVALGVRLRTVPTLTALGHRLDARGQRTTTIGTAVELALDPDRPRTLVERAAIDDAIEHARDIRPGDVVPFRPPRWLWVAPLALGFAFAVTLVQEANPPDSAGPLATAAPGGAPDGPPEPSVVSREQVRRVTELLGREDTIDDDYLRAVATGFEELADRLDDPGTSDAQLREELEPLLAHLERAVAGRDDAVGRLLRDLAASRLETRPTLDARATTEEPTGVVTGDEEGADAPDGGPPASNAEVDDLLERLEVAMNDARPQSARRGPGERPEGLEPEGFYGGIFDDEGAPRTPSGNLVEGDAAGQAVGAAQRSNERAGDAAGDGGQNGEPDGSGDAFEAIDVDLESLDLASASDDPDGARVEGEGLREGRASSAPTSIRPSVARRANRVPEGSIANEGPGDRYHAVVERYFLPAASRPPATP